MSTLTKSQVKKFTGKYTENGKTYNVVATVRHDDNCGNGHNTFSITGESWEVDRPQGSGSCGCIHDEIAKAIPQLAPYIKFHFCSTDGPLHYLANTLYHAGDKDHNGLRKGKERKLDFARSSAIWPDATDDELCSDKIVLEGLLKDRLPALMDEFRQAVESLGFTY